VLGGEILGIKTSSVYNSMTIPATEILHRLGHRHRALLRAGVMGLSAVSSAGCSRDLRCAAHVPEDVTLQDKKLESCRLYVSHSHTA
jgi:hypothetical protein